MEETTLKITTLLKMGLKSIKDKCKEEKQYLYVGKRILGYKYQHKTNNVEVWDFVQRVLSLACLWMHRNIYICLWFCEDGDTYYVVTMNCL